MLNTLESLFNTKEKKTPVEGSYTNKLLSDKTFSKEKVLEEINELIEAVDNNSNKIHEAADVFYHLIMYLEANHIKIEDIMKELDKRKMSYDDNNIFAKILRGEIPCKKFMKMILYYHFMILIHKKKFTLLLYQRENILILTILV